MATTKEDVKQAGSSLFNLSEGNTGKKRGRKRNPELPRSGGQTGVRPGWKRTTYLISDEMYNFIVDYAYTERTDSLKDALNEILTIAKDSIMKQYKKECKELLHKPEKDSKK